MEIFAICPPSGVKAGARGKPHWLGMGNSVHGIAMAVMFPLFSQFWKASYNCTNVITEAFF